MKALSFARQAEEILALRVAQRVNKLGGYGADGEVIYEAHPVGCPSVLVTSLDNSKATFMSNGSIAFEIKLANSMEIHVLHGSFDATEKHETNTASNNLWIDVGAGAERLVASLLNPRAGVPDGPESIKIVKLGDPCRAMWFCASFRRGALLFSTAVKFSLVRTSHGPALLRETFIQNNGRRNLTGKLWGFYHLHGTQRFVYNKEIWYDSGLPVTPKETVVAATVPYTDILQLKRLSSAAAGGLKPGQATCDYSSFVGDSAALMALPQAVKAGALLPHGAGRKLNRFSSATIAANQFTLNVPPGAGAQLRQSLLYVTDKAANERFRREACSRFPDYPRVAQAFLRAAKDLLKATPDVRRVAAGAAAAQSALAPPAFEFALPRQKVVSEYAKSLWTGVEELYENCRAHGAKLANGIELGTRDRSQDMWPKMKENPGRVRADLVHTLSFMYVTNPAGARWSKPLTRAQKLHGMFPRQYPSRWDDRSQEVLNDNRPYADSPLWLIDSLNMYVRETGDAAILAERVKTVRLFNPEFPETSGIVGCGQTYTIAEVVLEVLECFRRHVADSPYGLAQVMYGDWCDPLDMFGTSIVGDAATRGRGRGTNVRLSAHLFASLVRTVEMLESARVRSAVKLKDLDERLGRLKILANQLRLNIVKFAWEDGVTPGFISVIHELKKNGQRPEYRKGGLGYTLGSMKGRDFDGVKRRELLVQAWCLNMLMTRRAYLEPVPRAEQMIKGIFATTDKMLFSPRLGLRLFHPPVANNELSRKLVGRMGVVPAGCAENGEYHHGQMMMHYFRLLRTGQADLAWAQFKNIISACRDETLAGPFEMPANSYASDRADPHFGGGMGFGLSGTTNWSIEFFQKVAGLTLNLHDADRLAIHIDPRLPAELEDTLTLKRIVHYALPGGKYRPIPLELNIKRRNSGSTLKEIRVTINGRAAARPEVKDLKDYRRVEIEITRVYEE